MKVTFPIFIQSMAHFFKRAGPKKVRLLFTFFERRFLFQIPFLTLIELQESCRLFQYAGRFFFHDLQLIPTKNV